MRAAPTIDMFLTMPIMRDPPLYTIRDLKTWVTLTDVLDAHEILTLEAAHAEKAELSRGKGA